MLLPPRLPAAHVVLTPATNLGSIFVKFKRRQARTSRTRGILRLGLMRVEVGGRLFANGYLKEFDCRSFTLPPMPISGSFALFEVVLLSCEECSLLTLISNPLIAR
jgi:hypothetical protein